MVGRGKGDGVFGSGGSAGLVGYGVRKGIGVVGAARSGPGGLFQSERGYSLVAGGGLEDRGLAASDLALLVRGRSRFSGTLYVGDEAAGVADASIAAFFEVDNADVVVPGDVLISSKKAGVLTRCRDKHSSQVMGVVVDRAGIVLGSPHGAAPDSPEGFADGNPPGQGGKKLVAFSGVVHLRAVGDKRPIRPGDLLVSSAHPGRVEGLAPDAQVGPGVIIGRSLDELKDREGVVRAVLVLN